MAHPDLSRYRPLADWPAIPPHVRLGYTHGVAFDAHDHCIIFHQGSPNVLIFAADGSFESSWGTEWDGGAHGLLLNREGDREFLYLAHERGGVVKTTLDGEVVLRLPPPPRPDIYAAPNDYKPTSVAVAPDGTIFVADGYGKDVIHRYAADGAYIATFGGTGSEDGQFKCPHGIAIDLRGPQPLLLVADRGNVRISIFTLDGTWVRSIRAHELRHPCSFAFQGDLLWIPDLFYRVTLWDASWNCLGVMGDSGWTKPFPKGWPNIDPALIHPQRFVAPHALAVSRDGDAVVVEWTEKGRITRWQQQ